MKSLGWVVVTATAMALLGCHKDSASASGAADGGVGSTDDGPGAVVQPVLSASAAVPAQLSASQAEALGMDIARRRWPQYHPKLATSLRMNGVIKVSIQMMEPGVGAHVILDYKGNYVDGGTSNGEH
jgi:hypothetical protein